MRRMQVLGVLIAVGALSITVAAYQQPRGASRASSRSRS